MPGYSVVVVDVIEGVEMVDSSVIISVAACVVKGLLAKSAVVATSILLE